MSYIVCPGCGARFDAPQVLELASLDGSRFEAVAVPPLEVQADGTAFRALRAGEERHIDQRVRCPKCSHHQR